MAEERNIRIEDCKGNAYYPHAKAKTTFLSNGKNVEEQLGNLSTLKTTNKNNIIEALNEVFTNANNGKKLISSVVGSPLLATDSFQQQRDKIQGLKNTFASNLTGKGQNSIETESLDGLVDKIKNISTGKKFAKGSLTINSYGNFSVSGLSFTPKNIILYIFQPVLWRYCTYGYSGDIAMQAPEQKDVMGVYESEGDNFIGGTLNINIPDKGNSFSVRYDDPTSFFKNAPINWIAIE